MKLKLISEYNRLAPGFLNTGHKYPIKPGEPDYYNKMLRRVAGEPHTENSPEEFEMPAQPRRSGNQYTVPSPRLRDYFNAGPSSASPEDKLGDEQWSDPSSMVPMPNATGSPQELEQDNFEKGFGTDIDDEEEIGPDTSLLDLINGTTKFKDKIENL